jgi:hypothetical protein
LPKKPTVKQQLKVAQMRARLGKQVKSFLQAANLFLPNLEEVDLMPLKEEIIDTPAEETVVPDPSPSKFRQIPTKFLLNSYINLTQIPSNSTQNLSQIPSRIARIQVH